MEVTPVTGDSGVIFWAKALSNYHGPHLWSTSNFSLNMNSILVKLHTYHLCYISLALSRYFFRGKKKKKNRGKIGLRSQLGVAV